jgi:hypothetical protein
MAQRVITYVQYTDDLTGETFTEGEGETLVYAFDGSTYEIDLVEANAKAFRMALAPFVAVSRKTVDTRGRKLTAGGGHPARPARPGQEVAPDPDLHEPGPRVGPGQRLRGPRSRTRYRPGARGRRRGVREGQPRAGLASLVDTVDKAVHTQ